MKIIHNRILPLPGFGLMNILGLVFSRKPEKEITLVEKRHEQTHTLQQYELLMIGAVVSLVLCNIYATWWYLLGVVAIPFAIYIACFLVEMAIPPYHNLSFGFVKGEGLRVKCMKIWAVFVKIWMDAYHDNCFEREAYMNDHDRNYLATRRLCGMFYYIIPKKSRKDA